MTRVERRAFIGTFTLLAAPLATEAQQPAGKVPIGFLSANARAAMSARTEAFRVDRLRALVTELVRLKVSVIVTEGTTATRFAKEATPTSGPGRGTTGRAPPTTRITDA